MHTSLVTCSRLFELMKHLYRFDFQGLSAITPVWLLSSGSNSRHLSEEDVGEALNNILEDVFYAY